MKEEKEKKKKEETEEGGGVYRFWLRLLIPLRERLTPSSSFFFLNRPTPVF